MKKKFAAVVAIALCVTFALAACGGGGTTPPASGGSSAAPGSSAPAPGGSAPSNAPDSITIGIPMPFTGNIAGFGFGAPFVQQLVCDKVNADGGVYVKDYDKKIPIKVDIQDSQGTQDGAGKIAEQMVTNDHVTMLIAQHTPDNTVPVINVAEKYGVPCVSNGCPSDAVRGLGQLQWTYHAFWDTTDCISAYIGLWKQLGYGPGTVVGFLFPNDADALSWTEIANKLVPEAGYTVSNPGTYPAGNTDWTSIINQFKKDKVQIIIGNDFAFDFNAFATQAVQQGFSPEFTTMGRAFLFPSDANALPMSIANGLTSEVWWAPSWPFKSSLDGMTCQQLADAWMKSGEQGSDDWYATLGDKYDAMEVCIDSITRAGSLDPAKIRDALAATDLDTIGGHVKYDQTTHIGVMPVTVGQWFLNDAGDKVSVKVVYTGKFTDVQPEATAFKPTKKWGS